MYKLVCIKEEGVAKTYVLEDERKCNATLTQGELKLLCTYSFSVEGVELQDGELTCSVAAIEAEEPSSKESASLTENPTIESQPTEVQETELVGEDNKDSQSNLEKVDDATLLTNLVGEENAQLYEHYFFLQSKLMFDSLAQGNTRLASNGRTAEYLKKKQEWLNDIQAKGEWEYCGFYHIEHPNHDYCTLGHKLHNVYFAWNEAGVDEQGNKYPPFQDLAFGVVKGKVDQQLKIAEILAHPNVIKFGSTCVGDFFKLTKEQTSILTKSESAYRKDKKLLIDLYSKNTPEQIEAIKDEFKILDEFVENIGYMDIAREMAGEPPIASTDLAGFYKNIRKAGLIPPLTLVRNLRASILKDDYFAKYNKPLYSPNTLKYVAMNAGVATEGFFAEEYGKNHVTSNMVLVRDKGFNGKGVLLQRTLSYFVDYTVFKLMGAYAYDGANYTLDGGTSDATKKDYKRVKRIETQGMFFTDLAFNLDYFKKVAELINLQIRGGKYKKKFTMPTILPLRAGEMEKVTVETKTLLLDYAIRPLINQYPNYTPLRDLYEAYEKLDAFYSPFSLYGRNENAFNRTLDEFLVEFTQLLDTLDKVYQITVPDSEEYVKFETFLNEQCAAHNANVEALEAQEAAYKAELEAEKERKRLDEETERAERLQKEQDEKKKECAKIKEIFLTYGIFKDYTELICYMAQEDYSGVRTTSLVEAILDTCISKGSASEKQAYYLEQLVETATGKKVQYGVVLDGVVTVTKASKERIEVTPAELRIIAGVIASPQDYDLQTKDVDRTVSILKSVSKSKNATEKQRKYVDIALKAYHNKNKE